VILLEMLRPVPKLTDQALNPVSCSW